MDNLPELRDIHLPQVEVSVFPPAYGWWVILATIIALFFLYELFLNLRRKSKKRFALRAIEDTNGLHPIKSAIEMSEVLRRICIYKYPLAAALWGKEWVSFLNEKCSQKLSGKAQELLINAPYASEDTHSFDREDVRVLREFCLKWVGENL